MTSTPRAVLLGLTLAVLPLGAGCDDRYCNEAFYLSLSHPCTESSLSPPPPIRSGRSNLADQVGKKMPSGALPLQKAFELVEGLELPMDSMGPKRLVSFSVDAVKGQAVDISRTGEGQIRATFLSKSRDDRSDVRRLDELPHSADGELSGGDTQVVEFAVVVEKGGFRWRSTRTAFLKPALPWKVPPLPLCDPVGRIELHVEPNGTVRWLTLVAAESAPCGPSSPVPPPADDPPKPPCTCSPSDPLCDC